MPDDPETEVDEEIDNLLTTDFEIGHYIRERIIPRAVLYFTGLKKFFNYILNIYLLFNMYVNTMLEECDELFQHMLDLLLKPVCPIIFSFN